MIIQSKLIADSRSDWLFQLTLVSSLTCVQEYKATFMYVCVCFFMPPEIFLNSFNNLDMIVLKHIYCKSIEFFSCIKHVPWGQETIGYLSKLHCKN